MLEKVFKFNENGTNVKTEIIAGLTTFMTISYIIALQPNILTQYNTGSPLWNGVFLATCIASFIAMMCMGLLANKPFCLGPGMGINAFFVVICTELVTNNGFDYTKAFQTVMCIVLFEGILFVILSFFSIREKIVDAIPASVKLGMAPAIGLMIINIGLGSNIYIADENYNQFFVPKDFFGALTARGAKESMGTAYPVMVLSTVTLLIGLFVIIALERKGIKASVILGMFAATVVYWGGQVIFLKQNPFEKLSNASFVPAFSDMAETTLFKLNFKGLLEMGWTTIITLVITFCFIDMFDTIGTLVGTASRAGMLDENGKMPGMKEALLSDAIGTVAGSLTGTSTITTFIESASGVEAGGRTGLTAVICGIMFLACVFLAPVAAIIPAAATSSALVYVGVLMVSGLKKIDFDDFSSVAPVAIMMISMPVSGSIGNSIGLGIVFSTIIDLLTGKKERVSAFSFVVSVLFIVKFFITV